MSARDKDSGFSENQADNTRNNNGTIGGEGGIEKDPQGSFHEMTERVKEGNPPNVRGIRENEESHAIGKKTHQRSTYAKNEIDPNMPGSQNSEGKEIRYPKKGYNHVDNPGGTSEEDLNKNNPDL